METLKNTIIHNDTSFTSSISIEATGKNLMDTLNTVSQIINAESIMRVFVNDIDNLNAKNEVNNLLILPSSVDGHLYTAQLLVVTM